jgi:Yip1 domain
MAAAPVLPPSPAPAPETATLSEGARIIDTFIAPSKTFTDLRRSASWWAPWLLISVFSLLFAYSVQQQVTFDQITKNEIARSPKASDRFEKLSPEQQAQQMRISNIIILCAFYGSPAIILLIDLIVAAVLFATFKVAVSADLKFKAAFAVVIYAGLPGIVGAILGTIAMFSGINPEGFNVNNPVGTNPAYYMDPAGSKFVLGLASIPDVINIWSIALLGIGFACAGKVKRSTAITIVVVLYLVWKLGTAALAGARG